MRRGQGTPPAHTCKSYIFCLILMRDPLRMQEGLFSLCPMFVPKETMTQSGFNSCFGLNYCREPPNVMISFSNKLTSLGYSSVMTFFSHDILKTNDVLYLQ